MLKWLKLASRLGSLVSKAISILSHSANTSQVEFTLLNIDAVEILVVVRKQTPSLSVNTSKSGTL